MPDIPRDPDDKSCQVTWLGPSRLATVTPDRQERHQPAIVSAPEPGRIGCASARQGTDAQLFIDTPIRRCGAASPPGGDRDAVPPAQPLRRTATGSPAWAGALRSSGGPEEEDDCMDDRLVALMLELSVEPVEQTGRR